MKLQIDKAGREVAPLLFSTMTGLTAAFLAGPYMGKIGQVLVFILVSFVVEIAIDMLIDALVAKKIVELEDDGKKDSD